jgi:hypothetical protein
MGAQRGSLVEHVEVADSELLVHTLGDFEFSVIFGCSRLMVSKFDGARSSFALNSELNKLGRGNNSEGFIKRVELFADLGELSRVYSDNWAVFSLGDSEVFLVERDKVHGEFSNSFSLGVLKDELEVSRVIFSLESDAVGRVSKFHDFSKSGNAESENHVGVGTVVLETFHAQVEGNESNMRSVHSLER